MRGVELTVQEIALIGSGYDRTENEHWMFNDRTTGHRLLNYWPSTGTWIIERNGQRGRGASPSEALMLAFQEKTSAE
jgi:hypothetical protein